MAVVAAAVQMIAVGVAALEAVVVARQAVMGALARVGQAQVALLAHPGQADAAGVGVVEAARHLAQRLAARRPAAAHAVVARAALHALDMHGDVARAAGELECAGLFARAAARAQLGAAFVAFFGHGGGDLVVEHVDHAADGASAMDQRRWAAQHLDLARQHRLGHHGVVGADGGGIVQLGTIAQHLDARAVHAADDGAARARAEVAAGDAGLAAQRLAQRGLAPAHQFIAFEHGGGGGHFGGAQLQPAGAHRDLGQRCLRRGGGVAASGGRQRQNGAQGLRQGDRHCGATRGAGRGESMEGGFHGIVSVQARPSRRVCAARPALARRARRVRNNDQKRL